MMNQPKRKLAVDMGELEFAMQQHDPYGEISYFLDLETGAVVMTTGEARRLLDEVYEEYGDPETGPLDLPAILPQLDIPDWQQQTLLEADQVEAGFGTRYVGVPQVESFQGYNDMEAFIDTVSNPGLQDRLEIAIRGKGAFRRFKDVLLDYPQERERWFEFSNDRMHHRALEWLQEEGIEPI